MAGPYDVAQSLGETQLLAQITLASDLNTSALTVMAVDAALGGIAVAGKDVLEGGWWLPLIAIFASACACYIALVFSAERAGPTISQTIGQIQAAGANQDPVAEWTAQQLELAIHANSPHIQRKGRAVAAALGLIFLAVLLALLSALVIS